MKVKKKLFNRNIQLYLPIIALLAGMLIMATGKPIVIQSTPPVPMPQAFAGEYSFDQHNWYPLEKAADLSALNGDL
jgi:hypothetical protein